MDRLEDERKTRGQSKRYFALEVLGVTAQTYNNWIKRGVPNDQGQHITGKLHWSLDYLWRGKAATDHAATDFKDETLQSIDEVAKRLPDAARIDLLNFANYLQWRDAPKKSMRKRAITAEKKVEANSA